MTALIVLAKECLPGRVKTRLHPPLSLVEAAEAAAASLAVTLERAGGLGFTRHILCFSGVRPPAEAAGWEVLPQVDGGLDERIAAALDAVSGPVLLIGMDGPQFDAGALAELAMQWPAELDAAFGPATDGGFWALGFGPETTPHGHSRGDLVRGVPMSQDSTGQVQLERLHAAGLRVRTLPSLRDIDTISDLHAAAALLPGTELARFLAGTEPAHCLAGTATPGGVR